MKKSLIQSAPGSKRVREADREKLTENRLGAGEGRSTSYAGLIVWKYFRHFHLSRHEKPFKMKDAIVANVNF